jgi:hypothetical protein
MGGPARMAEYFPIQPLFSRTPLIKMTDEFGVYARRIHASFRLAASG